MRSIIAQDWIKDNSTPLTVIDAMVLLGEYQSETESMISIAERAIGVDRQYARDAYQYEDADTDLDTTALLIVVLRDRGVEWMNGVNHGERLKKIEKCLLDRWDCCTDDELAEVEDGSSMIQSMAVRVLRVQRNEQANEVAEKADRVAAGF